MGFIPCGDGHPSREVLVSSGSSGWHLLPLRRACFTFLGGTKPGISANEQSLRCVMHQELPRPPMERVHILQLSVTRLWAWTETPVGAAGLFSDVLVHWNSPSLSQVVASTDMHWSQCRFVTCIRDFGDRLLHPPPRPRAAAFERCLFAVTPPCRQTCRSLLWANRPFRRNTLHN